MIKITQECQIMNILDEILGYFYENVLVIILMLSDFYLILKCEKGPFRGFFFGLLFGSCTCFCHHSFINSKLYGKMLHLINSGIFINFEIEIFLCFLTQFNQQAFIAYHLAFQLLDINIRTYHPIKNKFFAIFISSVQINGSN